MSKLQVRWLWRERKIGGVGECGVPDFGELWGNGIF